jgi:hypothetical protein
MSSPLPFALRLAAALMMLPLTGCSAALESLRPTYDERDVVPGADRPTIEGQLGEPLTVVALSGGATQVTYRTSRVSHEARGSIAASHGVAAVLSLGLSEIVYLPYVHENEARLFRVEYDAGGKAVHIESACEAGKLKMWVLYSTEDWPACAHGFVSL